MLPVIRLILTEGIRKMEGEKAKGWGKRGGNGFLASDMASCHPLGNGLRTLSCVCVCACVCMCVSVDVCLYLCLQCVGLSLLIIAPEILMKHVRMSLILKKSPQERDW